MSTGILLFVLAILVVVMIHESGHFLVAKAFGFKATKFFVGFGPRLWSFKKGETEYGIAAIPAGGFVKIVGMNPYEEVAPEDQPRAYPNKPIWQRALLLVAGSATHWVVAFIILLVTSMTIGFPTGRATNEVAAVETRLESPDGEVLSSETPASAAGLRPGYEIVAVDGRPTRTWTAVRNAIRAHPNESVDFTYVTGTRTQTVEVELGTALVNDQERIVSYCEPYRVQPGVLDEHCAGVMPSGEYETVGFLGIQPEPEYDKDNFIGAIGTAGRYTGEVTALSVLGIGQVFDMVFGGELWAALQGEGEREFDEGPLGIVGAGRIAGESVERGDFLNLIGLIVGFTIFVGLMNLLPLPPLDGGHLAVLVWEKVTGRAVDIRKLIPIAAAVISFFVILFLAVLYLDLARPIRVPF
jgi:membrane-associated protease RseP (regulator of RpoE activity)